MNSTPRFAVMGSGNGARAFCGQIAALGMPVRMFEPLEATADFLKLKEEREIFLEGDIRVHGRLDAVTMDAGEAMEGADIVLVVVPSFAHPSIFSRMIPHLKDGTHVVIVPGNYGGLLLKKMMAEAGCKARAVISETATLPYACRISAYNTVQIYKKKYRLKLATSPADRNGAALGVMNGIFGGLVEFFPAKNLLEMGLENANYTLHPLPILLNYGAIEMHGPTFRHYMDGITPIISEKVEAMDAERVAIGKALGLDLVPAMTQLKMYYGENDAKTIYEYVNSPDSPYVDIVGHNVKSRYLTEDVPGLLVPAIHLAHLAGTDAPIAKLVVDLASFLHGTDYMKNGMSPEKLGLGGKTLEEIIRVAS
jgi:opine dehydrogenase